MSIEALKEELRTLNPDERRKLTAFLVSLENANDEAYRKALAEKIDRPASDFATLEEMDRRLGFSGD